MAGIFPHGTTVSWGSTPIGGCTDVPIPQRDREDVEVTDQNSNFDRQYVPGLREPGTYELPLRLIPGDPGQEEVVSAQGNAADIRELVITLPDHASPRLYWTVDAYVKTTSGNLPWENSAAERNVVFKLTGQVVEGQLSSV